MTPSDSDYGYVVHVMHGEEYDFYGGRPNPKVPPEKVGEWGNPFVLKSDDQRGSTLADYLLWLVQERPDVIVAAKRERLHLKVGACWCAKRGGLEIDDPLRCHLQVLMRAARGDYDDYRF